MGIPGRQFHSCHRCSEWRANQRNHFSSVALWLLVLFNLLSLSSLSYKKHKMWYLWGHMGKKYNVVEYRKGPAEDLIGILTSIIANIFPQRALHMNTKHMSHFGEVILDIHRYFIEISIFCIMSSWAVHLPQWNRPVVLCLGCWYRQSKWTEIVVEYGGCWIVFSM